MLCFLTLLVYTVPQIMVFCAVIARTFLSMESRIIGLRFDSGPLGFPGFCSGVKMPTAHAVSASTFAGNKNVEMCVVSPNNLYYSDPGHASYHVR